MMPIRMYFSDAARESIDKIWAPAMASKRTSAKAIKVFETYGANSPFLLNVVVYEDAKVVTISPTELSALRRTPEEVKAVFPQADVSENSNWINISKETDVTDTEGWAISEAFLRQVDSLPGLTLMFSRIVFQQNLLGTANPIKQLTTLLSQSKLSLWDYENVTRALKLVGVRPEIAKGDPAYRALFDYSQSEKNTIRSFTSPSMGHALFGNPLENELADQAAEHLRIEGFPEDRKKYLRNYPRFINLVETALVSAMIDTYNERD